MRTVVLGLFLVWSAAPLEAQEPAPDPCPEERISHIFIDNHSIFDTTDPDLDERFAWAYELANSLHVRTRGEVIRRELLLEVGGCWDPELASESERLLRGLDFLARVDIFPVPQADGTVHVVVDTQDEWSTRVDLGARLRDGKLALEAIRLEEANLLGTGQSIGLFYRDDEYVNQHGVQYRTPQLAGTRWDLTAELGRTRAGTTVAHLISYPFVGEVGRWAAAQGFRRSDRHFRYVADDTAQVRLPVREQSLDAALLTRVGHPGNLTVLGAALSFQEVSYPGGGESLLVSSPGRRDAPATDTIVTAALRPQLEELNTIRLVFLVGQRNIWWIRRRGFDAMRGVQDLRLGAEVELAVGRSLTALEEDDDISTTLTLFTGLEHPLGLMAIRGRLDARRDFDAAASGSEWEDVLAEGEVLSYLRPSPESRHTLLLRAAAAGGWHTRTPFQLTLGGESAVRGYDRDRFPGGRRLVLTAEDRIYFGWPFADVLDLGGTVFVDAGRMWPGDVPFGIHSRWRWSAGLGLRGSFPAGSRTTYRLDLAFPVGGGDGYRLTMTVGELIGVTTGFGDPQLDRSRRAGLSGDVFKYPR